MRADICKMLGISYPIIQGGMAGIATGAFAAAVSEAGGLGLIATGGFSLDEISREICLARSLTAKPVGLNILLTHPQVDGIVDLVIAQKVPVVTTGAGLATKYMPRLTDAGCLVLPVVASVAFARRSADAGASAVIAEGCESGGHVGETTTMALVPQVARALDVPVIAAGGIATGAQMHAAFALGASGVQVGTMLLVSDECPIHENYKQAVISAGDIDTVVTGRISGSGVRVIKNSMSIEYLKREKAGASKTELDELTLGSLKKAIIEGDTKNGSLMAGQVAGLVKKRGPVSGIIGDLYRDFLESSKGVFA